jgi:xanthine dehydrogenase YagT iron-sulfur-binding subunit
VGTSSNTSAALPQVGDRAPDFDLALADGRRVGLAELAGQPVVLAFFPEEWDPSRGSQVRTYQSALERLPGQSHFLNIHSDGLWCDVELGGEAPVRFPMVTNFASNEEIAERYGVAGRQAIFVLDGNGVVRWRYVGAVGSHPSTDEIARAVEQALPHEGVSRRRLLATALAASVTLLLLPRLALADPVREGAIKPGEHQADRQITLHVNGHDHRLDIDPRVTLLDALRERLGLFGTKKGCDHGQCGACTVHVDGRRVNSCLMLAMQAEGTHITTIEGLASGNRLHPVQEAFIKHDGFQCGYCTPGQIMSAVACIHEGHAKTDAEIREFMSGNICRCGAYVGIVEAIKEARGGQA